MDFDQYYERALPYIQKIITKPLDLRHIATMVKTRIEIFPDINEEMIGFFEALPEYSTELYINKKSKTTLENSLALLREVQPLLSAQEDFSNDALFELLSAYGKEKGYKTGFIMWPIRIALSGRQMTPAGATEIMEVLGKEESLQRIADGIRRLEA